MDVLHYFDRLGRELADEVGGAGLDDLIEKYVDSDPLDSSSLPDITTET
ncbi:hypothetical protein BH23CHL1_BH23CHL1_04520 [soil metagenome]